MSRQRGPGFRTPWDRDPKDKEAQYVTRKPIPMFERIRLALKGAAALLAYVWFQTTSNRDGDVGPRMAIALGAALTVAGLVDAVALKRGALESVFFDSKRGQAGVVIAFLVSGVALLAIGVTRLT